ncbi:high mobility group B protein 3-like [Mangifera indica]|uniref:high mobility group B protein 3-like n=1 Tax=Mangifera indica TaxID=29780 RepID=UPI001CFBB429|nr:high mobility group B protein 3-like [Mangifera indica]
MKGGRSKAEDNGNDTKLKSRGAKAGKRKAKAAKDPNKPKRPPSAFFVFMEEFRVQFKRENPDNKSVAAVGKAGGEKWKSMSDAEKAPYVAKAESRKNDYNKSMKAYNKKLADGENGVEENESDKSKSEVNDEDEDGSGTAEEDEDDD